MLAWVRMVVVYQEYRVISRLSTGFGRLHSVLDANVSVEEVLYGLKSLSVWITLVFSIEKPPLETFDVWTVFEFRVIGWVLLVDLAHHVSGLTVSTKCLCWVDDFIVAFSYMLKNNLITGVHTHHFLLYRLFDGLNLIARHPSNLVYFLFMHVSSLGLLLLSCLFS